MYCTKCGKFIGTDAVVCDECKQKEAAVSENAVNETEYRPVNVQQEIYAPSPIVNDDAPAINLGKSIAAMVLSTIGFIFIYLGLCLSLLPPAAIVCAIIGFIPTVLGLAFGIHSISYFKRTAKIRSGKRIPLLVLGISSGVFAATAMFCLLCLVAMVLAFSA